MKNILTSAQTFSKEEYELKLKYILFNSLLLFNVVVVSIATVARYLNGQYIHVAVDTFYIFSSVAILLLTRKYKKHFNYFVYTVIFYSFIVVAFGFSTVLSYSVGISWFMILLMITFFLLGSKDGDIIFLLSLLTILGVAIFKFKLPFMEVALGVIPFFVALIFLHFSENRNRTLKIALKNSNLALQKHNETLCSRVKESDTKISTLHKILDNSPISVIITDLNGSIEYVNPWFSKLTGYSFDEVIGKNPKVLKSDFHNDKYYKNLWRDVKNNQVWNGVFKNIKKSGEVYWESAIIAPINDEDGNITNIMGIKQEITKEIYLKEQLLEKDRQREENFVKTLESFVQMVESRDTYTAGHSQRVAKYSKLIALEMNLSKEECSLIYRAGILHDIGKIATPDSILLKPGKLTNLEYKLITDHVQVSYEILSSIPMYKDMADIIISHHERYDGKGYPQGLKGEEISLLSSIMVVADAFDAMTTNRIYKGRKNIKEALEELRSCSQKHFNPEVVDAAVIALAGVKLEETVNQLPKTDLEKERFSYFYKDQVTGIFNADYLQFILAQNNINREFRCINILYMHNFSIYNNNSGWTAGDRLLTSFTEYLTKKFPEALIFRIYGDDFVLVNREHIDIDLRQFEDLEILTEHNITITNRHIDSSSDNITYKELKE